MAKQRRYRAVEERRAQEEADGGRVCSYCAVWRRKDEFGKCAWERSTGFAGCRGCLVGHNRRYRLMSRYGLTERVFDALAAGQGFACALCGRTEPEDWGGNKPFLVVDHCHETGKVRGLLCDKCNVSLGRLGDSVERIERVLAYVRGWK